MAEWRAGVLPTVIRANRDVSLVTMRVALGTVAAAVEKQAKINARNGSHKYGTKTPAVHGQGPAVISGTLRRSIVHGRVERLDGFAGYLIKVGMAAGVYPLYTSKTGRAVKNDTPSSKYALYLETVWNYPFLGPAYQFVTRTVAPNLWRAAYLTTPWVRVL